MNYHLETINCNLCNADDFEEVSKIGKFGLPTNVVLCKNCGLGYLNPRWNRESYLHFYANEYDKYYRPQLTKSSTISKNHENVILTRLKNFTLLPQQVNNILDIGSGEGQNLSDFRSFFKTSNQYAIEPSLESQKYLKQNGVTVISGDVDASWSNNYQNQFDLIIMRHVLEHFMDPVKALNKVHDVLSDQGIVYIAVPNNLNPTQNLHDSWFRNVHTYYFNKFSLSNLLQITDFEMIKLVEGDDYNKGEVFLVAKKSAHSKAPQFSVEHFKTQYAVFKNKLNQESKLVYKGIYNLKKAMNTLRSKVLK